MSELKKPEAGEWWQRDWCRVLIVGRKLNGNVITETINGLIGTMQDEEEWQHLPDCDSFEWQPETFPQYWTSESPLLAFMKQLSKDDFVPVFLDGSEGAVRSNSTVDRTRLTQAEAEARVKKPEPVESPDDWVTQDRVPDRPGIDEWRRVFDGVPDGWNKSFEHEERYAHGHTALGGRSVVEVRCRRRDLPPLPQETPKRNYVRLWTHRTSGTVCTATDERYLKYPDIWTELKHDGTGFYLEDGK